MIFTDVQKRKKEALCTFHVKDDDKKVPDVVMWPTSELRERVINGRDGERAIFEEVEVNIVKITRK